MKLTRPERSWILYDVGNSAFILLVTTTIPILFREFAAAEGIAAAQSSGLWASVLPPYWCLPSFPPFWERSPTTAV